MLEALRAAELRAGRVVEFGAVRSGWRCSVTHVDALFSFVVERRFRCTSHACLVRGTEQGAVRAVCETADVLELGVPSDGDVPWRLTELYLRWCAPGFELVRCPSCGVCEKRNIQQRILAPPGILLVLLVREPVTDVAVQPRVSHVVPVDVEEHIELIGAGSLELASVLYVACSAATADTPPAVTCLCRGMRKRFSIITPSGRPEPTGLPVHRVKPREVRLLAYSSRMPGALVPGAVGGSDVRVGTMQALTQGQADERAAEVAVRARVDAVESALGLGSWYFMSGSHYHKTYA